jgi:hypothetical protein
MTLMIAGEKLSSGAKDLQSSVYRMPILYEHINDVLDGIVLMLEGSS